MFTAPPVPVAKRSVLVEIRKKRRERGCFLMHPLYQSLGEARFGTASLGRNSFASIVLRLVNESQALENSATGTCCRRMDSAPSAESSPWFQQGKSASWRFVSVCEFLVAARGATC